MQSALEGLHSGKYTNIKEATKEEGVSAHFCSSCIFLKIFKVAHTTLGERFHGKHTSQKTAFESLQLITVAQEKTLLDWMDLSAMQGHSKLKNI